MARRRMFSSAIVLSDAFLDMPASARCLYFTFGMVADDDGFVNNPRSVMRQIGASDDDAKILLAKRYILGFESGVICIKHWRINNYIRPDRYQETTYVEEKETLTLDEKSAYTERYTTGIPGGIPSIGEISVGEINSGKSEREGPTLDEVRAYCEKDGLTAMDPAKFFDHYEAMGWRIKGNKIRDWQARARKWNREDEERAKKQTEEDKWFDSD